MAARKLAQNSYRNLGAGQVLGDHKAMRAIANTFDNRVMVCRQVLRLSYLTLHEAFQGMKGKAQLDGMRHAMIEDIAAWPGPVTSWRESAARILAASQAETL